MHSRAITLLYLCVLVGSLAAQTRSRQPAPASAVVATSGGYQLTEQLLQQALFFAQIQAGTAFSAADVASLRADLITWFQRNPAQEAQDYDAVAKFLHANNLRNSQIDYGVMRYKFWYALGQNPQHFRDFQSSPMGRMVLKYNPVLVNSGGVFITQRDVDWQFASNAFVAQIAGVAPPTQADEDWFARNLPSKFASMPTEQREYLRQSQSRLAVVHLNIDGTIKTKAALESDIRRNVHTSADVDREARQVENDSQYGAKYHQLSKAEWTSAFSQAQSVNRQIEGVGRASDGAMRNSQLPQLPQLPNGQPVSPH